MLILELLMDFASFAEQSLSSIVTNNHVTEKSPVFVVDS